MEKGPDSKNFSLQDLKGGTLGLQNDFLNN